VNGDAQMRLEAISRSSAVSTAPPGPDPPPCSTGRTAALWLGERNLGGGEAGAWGNGDWESGSNLMYFD